MFLAVLILSLFRVGQCKEVVYYIAIIEETWDYAPSGRNLINEESSEQYLSQRDGKIGHAYKKAMYREFTDDSFMIEAERPSYLGFMGPVINANVGDRIKVYLKNKGERAYSIRPLTLSYNSTNNGNGDSERRNDNVNPGDLKIYVWEVVEEAGPRMDDPECVTSLYYSDADMVKDVNSGLVGMMIICRNGTSDDVRQKHFALYLGTVDENKSWYLEENIQLYSNNTERNASTLINDHDFMGSNRMHSINGYVFGNLPPLTVCLNDEVHFHIAALGDTNDVHGFRVFGHSMVHKNHRTDVIPVYPGVTSTVTFNATEIGNWLLGSQTEAHWKGGMLGLISVDECDNERLPITFGKIRRYYIAAEQVTSEDSTSQMMFQQYTDGTFETRLERPPIDRYLGTLGPLITAEVGDTLKVVFYNRGSKHFSIYPRGLRMTKYHEGISYNDDTSVKRSVPPGGRKTYYWRVPQYFGPTEDDPVCRPSFYTSEASVFGDSQSGLIGPMLICKEGTLDASGVPIGKPKDMFLFFTQTLELNSEYFVVNGMKNNSSIPVCYNDTIDLNMMYVGINRTFVTVHFHGNPAIQHGQTHMSVGITSNIPLSVKMEIKREGYTSIENGNHRIVYNTEACELSENEENFGDPSTQYFIGVVEDNWDYSNGKKAKDEWRSMFPVSVGPVYRKNFYRLFYTTHFYYLKSKRTFTGPTLKVTVGDSIKIVLKNKATTDFTIHADGVIVEVEGKQNNDTVVKPGEKSTFIWKFPENTGPGNGDPPCIMRPYYSNINKQRDINSGLIGPLIICKKAVSDLTHIPLFIGEIDESLSWLVEENFQLESMETREMILKLRKLRQGNRLRVINGYAVGTFPDMAQISPGTDVYLHFMNFGSRFHSIHLEGNYFNSTPSTNSGTNVLGLYPGESYTMKVKMEKEGLWLLQGLGTEDQRGHLFGPYFVGLSETGNISK